MNVLDNSVMIKGSNSGITVFLDSEMAFEDLLKVFLKSSRVRQSFL